MISRDDVVRLSRLINIHIQEKAILRFQKELSRIIDFVGAISRVSGAQEDDTQTHTHVRDDVPERQAGETLSYMREQIPKQRDGYVVVPQVINKEENE